MVADTDLQGVKGTADHTQSCFFTCSLSLNFSVIGVNRITKQSFSGADIMSKEVPEDAGANKLPFILYRHGHMDVNTSEKHF